MAGGDIGLGTGRIQLPMIWLGERLPPRMVQYAVADPEDMKSHLNL